MIAPIDNAPRARYYTGGPQNKPQPLTVAMKLKAPSATASVTTPTATMEAQIRSLSSVKERSENLKRREDKIKEKIAAQMTAAKLDKVETIYGDFIMRSEYVYDFSDVPEVVEAERRLKEAQDALGDLKEAAKANLTPVVKRTPAFNRNKAVSARTTNGYVLVQTTCSTKKKTKTKG